LGDHRWSKSCELFLGRQTYDRYLHIAEAVAEDEAQAAWDGSRPCGGRWWT
jgi:hypothetical protein